METDFLLVLSRQILYGSGILSLTTLRLKHHSSKRELI